MELNTNLNHINWAKQITKSCRHCGKEYPTEKTTPLHRPISYGEITGKPVVYELAFFCTECVYTQQEFAPLNKDDFPNFD